MKITTRGEVVLAAIAIILSGIALQLFIWGFINGIVWLEESGVAPWMRDNVIELD